MEEEEEEGEELEEEDEEGRRKKNSAGISSVVECLLNMRKTVGFNPQDHKKEEKQKKLYSFLPS